MLISNINTYQEKKNTFIFIFDFKYNLIWKGRKKKEIFKHNQYYFRVEPQALTNGSVVQTQNVLFKFTSLVKTIEVTRNSLS